MQRSHGAGLAPFYRFGHSSRWTARINTMPKARRRRDDGPRPRYHSRRRGRSALAMSATELKVMAAAAILGVRSSPKSYSDQTSDGDAEARSSPGIRIWRRRSATYLNPAALDAAIRLLDEPPARPAEAGHYDADHDRGEILEAAGTTT